MATSSRSFAATLASGRAATITPQTRSDPPTRKTRSVCEIAGETPSYGPQCHDGKSRRRTTCPYYDWTPLLVLPAKEKKTVQALASSLSLPLRGDGRRQNYLCSSHRRPSGNGTQGRPCREACWRQCPCAYGAQLATTCDSPRRLLVGPDPCQSGDSIGRNSAVYCQSGTPCPEGACGRTLTTQGQTVGSNPSQARAPPENRTDPMASCLSFRPGSVVSGARVKWKTGPCREPAKATRPRPSRVCHRDQSRFGSSSRRFILRLAQRGNRGPDGSTGQATVPAAGSRGSTADHHQQAATKTYFATLAGACLRGSRCACPANPADPTMLSRSSGTEAPSHTEAPGLSRRDAVLYQ